MRPPCKIITFTHKIHAKKFFRKNHVFHALNSIPSYFRWGGGQFDPPPKVFSGLLQKPSTYHTMRPPCKIITFTHKIHAKNFFRKNHVFHALNSIPSYFRWGGVNLTPPSISANSQLFLVKTHQHHSPTPQEPPTPKSSPSPLSPAQICL